MPQPQFRQAATGSTAASATTVAVTVVSTITGNPILVGCAGNGNRTITNVTDNIGNTYVQVPSVAASANAAADRTDIWYCANPTGGVTTITVTFSGAAGTHQKDAIVWEINGYVAGTISVDVVAAASDINQTTGIDDPGASGTVTTTSTSGFIVAVIKTPSGSAIAANPRAGNEFRSGGGICSSTLSAGCSLESYSAVAHKPVWDDGNSFINFCCSVAAFKGTATTDAPRFAPYLGRS